MLRAILVPLAVAAMLADAAAAPPTEANVRYRGHLDNSRLRFERERKGHVAFIGGSITEMNGYRPMVCKLLQKRFPQTTFSFTDAGISSTCSTSGAFRLRDDVLSKGPVDLLFIEFAVNDDQDAGHARRECIRGMEGIVRQTRQHNPAADVVFTYFVNPGMLQAIQAGHAPLSIAAHEAVARHYSVSTIHLAAEVARQISAGELTWEQFGGTHPAPRGNAICAAMIDERLGLAWQAPLPADAKKRPHTSPPSPLEAGHYGQGRFVDPRKAQADDGWAWHTPDWKDLPGQCRSRFADVSLLCADRPGAEFTLTFEGTAVGAYVLAGPDAGVSEVAVDGGRVRRVDLFHRYSRGLHYPRTVLFFTDLDPGRHLLELRVSENNNPDSSGHAVRVLRFAVN